MGLKLGLTAAIPDKAVGEEVGTCVYTLFSAASGTTSSFVFYGVKSRPTPFLLLSGISRLPPSYDECIRSDEGHSKGIGDR